MSTTPEYHVARAAVRPELNAIWDAPAWVGAHVGTVEHYHPEGSDHRPLTEFKLMYGDDGLHGIFRVHDRYVRCLRTEYQSAVCRDACVEIFVQPKPDRGYVQLEMNCATAMLLGYRHVQDGVVVDKERSPESLGKRVGCVCSIGRIVDPEIAEPLTWTLQYYLPFSVIETYCGPLNESSGNQWRGNFFKCSEDNSKPHWGAWASIGEVRESHQPDKFGVLVFEPHAISSI